MGLDPLFYIHGFDGAIGNIYNLTKDIFEALVIVGVIALLIRRIVFRPERLTSSIEANFILIAIFLLMVTDMLIDGSVLAMAGSLVDMGPYDPLAEITAYILNSMSLSIKTLANIFIVSYFVHIIGIVVFLNYLPYGKHFHIITSIPNVFFRNLKPYGAIEPLNLEDETATTFGINKINRFDWKSILDFYSCTECGRCQDQCPAYTCDKPLSPKEFIMDLRNQLYSVNTKLMRKSSWKNNLPDVLGNAVKKEAVWSCTTCRACEEACPLFIEWVQKMIDLRRHMVLMEGNVSPEAQTTLKNMETNSNPWGFSHTERGVWASDLGIKTMTTDQNVEYLYFVGCAGSFDERAKKISRAFTQLLMKAGVSFGILGEEEQCTGDSARRLGNEYLFQILARKNIETFSRYGIKKIITTCPHCYNTLKNEYPQFGGNYEVHHHSTFLNDLINVGRLTFDSRKSKIENRLTYHDSCYLGRYNNIYDAPRKILEAAGFKIDEMEKSKKYGRCCGAGGGRMWMEETEGSRFNLKRLEDIEKTDANTVASSCPFCLTMLTDAVKDKGVENKYSVKDIAELLLECSVHGEIACLP